MRASAPPYRHSHFTFIFAHSLAFRIDQIRPRIDQIWSRPAPPQAAVEFKAAHRISLADAFAVAFAARCDAELVTGDSELKALAGTVKTGAAAVALRPPGRLVASRGACCHPQTA